MIYEIIDVIEIQLIGFIYTLEKTHSGIEGVLYLVLVNRYLGLQINKLPFNILTLMNEPFDGGID